jgi:RNA polymerase sigma-70 factor, ECF subfamily
MTHRVVNRVERSRTAGPGQQGSRGLPLRQRVAVVLHHVGGLTVEEVAAELGSPAGTVKTLLYRGRAAMARQLGDEEKGRVLHHG